MSFRCDASGCGHSAKSMSALNRHHNKCKCFVTQFQDLSQRNASRKRNAQGISSEPESNYRRQKRRSDIKGNMVIDDTQFLGDTTTPPNVEDVYEPLVQDEWNGEEINVLLASEDFSANSPPKRPTHQRQIYVDVPPEGPGELLPPHIAPHQRTFTFRIPPAICETIPNSFGVYRKYSGRIDAIPDRIHGFTHLTSRSTQLGQESSNLTEPTRPIRKQYGPCRNQSVFALKYWHWVLGGAKTGVSQTQLIDLLQWDGFDQHQVKRSDATPVDEALGQPLELDTTIKRGDGWRRCNVGIAIPLPGQQNFDPHTSTTTTNSGNNIFQVPGLFLRSLSTIIKETLEQPTAKSFHWKPFQQFWRPNPAFPSQRIYDELYSSPIWLDADEWVQNLNIPGCNLPRAIAGLMFWSDATCVSEFGTRSLWPIYMFFGNQSKYDRSRPSSHAGHQVAFLPSIEDNIQDFVRDACGMSASKDLLTFCKRELMHEAWRLLLDGDFMDGWKHGWVIKCGDGIMRRIFPRIFTYSADYPEKALLATIRDKGGCPCPRCLVKMENTDKAGTPNDMIERSRRIRKDSLAVQALVLKARRSIFQDGKGVKSAAVEKVLKSHSLVPTVNAFSSLFTSADMNYYDIFVIDFLHEFELGIWKAVLTHLIRILHAFGEEKVHILDQRMRNTPIFGADTIRRFTNNVSELKKMAARDFEDILQTIIPAIEDLIDQPHDTTILHLLYQLAEYQALAKMRMHTDASLAHWDIVTKTVTNSLRAFQQSSQAIRTFETPRERNNRLRRSQAGPHAPATVNGPTLRTLNLRTYKFHAMGDGPATVRQYGTTDSYTTQIGERQHRVPKSMYRRSSKNRHATQQITVQEQRERNLRYLAAHNPGSLPPSFTPQPKSGSKAIGAITEAELGLHHFIAADEKRFIHLPTWLNDASRKTDPAFLTHPTGSHPLLSHLSAVSNAPLIPSQTFPPRPRRIAHPYFVFIEL
ncbi:hypothetical protein M408DRAFT_104783 [Serendipita vermifera MAFF 305830]|uniref:Uncharacterized protein n=1 Tax=Serendipita vermifera MAFF 305830 TaxID=933852 RepID=A0A0C2W4K8_SERVB|nr:hypothetical protein M408DRAFT_104783 [Serendipita vermifera MAFF 305830]